MSYNIFLDNVETVNRSPSVFSYLDSRELASCAQVSKGVKQAVNEWRVSTGIWGLGTRWWLQGVDGVYHRFGPLVFDKGLHKGSVEPGYLESLWRATEHVACRIFEVPFWRLEEIHQIHALACAHFSKCDSSTSKVIVVEKGKFRTEGATCRFRFCDDSQLTQEDRELYQKWAVGGAQPPIPEIVADQRKKWRLRLIRAQEYINQTCYETGVHFPFCHADHQEKQDEFSMDYYTQFLDLEFLQKITQQLKVDETKKRSIELASTLIQNRFEKAIGSAKNQDERLTAIARFFQLREWLHPYSDGNTRVNVLLLNALLVRFGFNPAILRQPFDASTLTLDEWVAYLKEGIAEWLSERKKRIGF